MLAGTLRFKIGIYVAVTLAAMFLLFAVLAVRHEREDLLREAAGHVNQLSDVIVRSTRFAMLQNQPEHVHNIIGDVARHELIDKVRIYSKEGVIIDSSLASEIGVRVDRNAEGCVQCHQGQKPLTSLPTSDRARLFVTPDGRRMLASMEVIRNEPSCYTAACHAHAADQPVLGVLDIVYPLAPIDRRLWTSGLMIVVLSIGFVVLASTLVGVFVHRFVYRPLGDLESGAKRLASGNLDDVVPVRSNDEFGRVASAFNTMMTALRDSREELRGWAHTLEQRVMERTKALRQAQAEALRGEKLASVGLLAAGIAHELNNPLTGVLTFSTLMRKKMAEGSQDAEDLDLVIRETKRCAGIIRRLLDFAREKKPEKRYCDLNQVVQDTVRIIERPATLSDIAIRLELDPSLPRAWVDEDLLKQVVMNMLVNAQHAMEPKDGIPACAPCVLTLRTRMAPEPKSPGGGAPAVAMAEISIIDTGCGIPEKDLQKIFDPFFTTKGVGRGTGLGLSVSHGIVEAHGGVIEVESAVGAGTTFRIYLPVEPVAAPVAAEEGAEVS